MSRKNRFERTCEHCGKTFDIPLCKILAGKGRFCSRECYVLGNRGSNNNLWQNGGTAEYICETCGKTIYDKPSHHRRFCSRKCADAWTSQRTGENAAHWKGGDILCVCQQCGEEFYTKRARALDKSRGVYCSKKCLYESRRVEKTEYARSFTEELKELIRKRENYVCCICGGENKVKSLHIHHIDYDKNNSDPRNLIALCNSCHTKTNTNRDYWQGYLTALMIERGLG